MSRQVERGEKEGKEGRDVDSEEGTSVMSRRPACKERHEMSVSISHWPQVFWRRTTRLSHLPILWHVGHLISFSHIASVQLFRLHLFVSTPQTIRLPPVLTPGATVPELDTDVGTGTEGDVEARCFSKSACIRNDTSKARKRRHVLTTERDSPRDQIIVTSFLLSVCGLLLYAGIRAK